MDPVELSLFAHRISAICDEMGAALKRSAFSPNIRDRLDFSCALFDAHGVLIGQSAAIPVHLGSMAYAMADLVEVAGDGEGQLICNDPYRGGTHLPDVTVVLPVRHGGRIVGWAANRAHHADIGSDSPGSMPISTSLAEEGICIEPTWTPLNGPVMRNLLERLADPVTSRGDFAAQYSANEVGARRLLQLIESGAGSDTIARSMDALNAYGEQLARQTVAALPDGSYRFEDRMEDDGLGTRDIPVVVTITISGDQLRCDFSGTADQVPGNINCPIPVTAAGVFYVLRCLMPRQTPNCAGCLAPISLDIPAGSLLNPRPGAAVAAGNVETSSRIVDAVCGALAQACPQQIPAAAQGTMNNLAMGAPGDHGWRYYETLAGGHGGSPAAAGASAVHSHMTNTLNTPIEVAERNFPLRILRYALRTGSGGPGRHPGGDGLVREYQLTAPAVATLITERRAIAPWGLAGGQPGRPGVNRLNDKALPAKTSINLKAGDRLTIETPGGGGWGKAER